MQDALPNAIVLAAGGSRRMGRAKAALSLAGRAVLAWHVDRLAAVSSSVTVVLGSDAERLRALLPPAARIVLNPDWATTWPVDSLRIALEAGDVRGPCWVSPVDVAPPHPTTLRALLAAGAPAVPVCPAGRDGHPVLISAAEVASLRSGPAPEGLRPLLADARRIPVDDPLVSADFDDPAAWARISTRWRDG